MTTLVLAMNKEAVALAADSAGTLRRNDSDHAKIYRANKVFALSKRRPVGAMWYNHSQFLGIPMETLFKEFRRCNPHRTHGYLAEWVSSFHDHLAGIALSLDDRAELQFIISMYEGFCDKFIRRFRKKMLEAAVKAEKELSEEQRGEIAEQELEAVLSDIVKGAVLVPESEQTASSFIERHADDLAGLEQEKFGAGGLPVPKLQKYRPRIMNLLMRHEHDLGGRTGVVVTGFGDSEWFPGWHHITISGSVSKKLRWKSEGCGGVNWDNTGAIVPFAQRDIIDTVVQGVHPDITRRAEENARKALCVQFPAFVNDLLCSKVPPDALPEIEKALSEVGMKTAEELIKLHREFVQAHHIGPLVRSVTYLSKDELANLVESLVMMTSLRRRMDIETAETVGGPIDVAVLSRTEGFIWIKRKHYFNPELNPSFLKHYDSW
jgi:hypothetical protein